MVSNSYSNKIGGKRRISNITTAGKEAYGYPGGAANPKEDIKASEKRGFGGIKRKK